MSIKTRIISTLFTATLVVGAVGAAMPATAGATPDEIANPPHCTHGCNPGPDWGGPDDLANPTADPGDPGDPGVDVPIPANATFTG
jgi:hypothetical protein